MVISDEVVCCPQLFHTFFSTHNPPAHPLPSPILLMLCFLSYHPPKRKTPQGIFHMLPSPVHHFLFSCFTGCFFSTFFVSSSILHISNISFLCSDLEMLPLFLDDVYINSSWQTFPQNSCISPISLVYL